MLDFTRYGFKILAHPKHQILTGREREGYSYHVTLTWDDLIWLQAAANSPEDLGEIVGQSITHLARAAEETMA